MRRYAGIVAVILFCLNMNKARAQWTQANGPYGGTVLCLAAMSNGSGVENVYAGTENGLYVSSINGSGWTPIGVSLQGSSVYSLAVSVSNLFAATSNGVFVSTDYGNSWQMVDNGLPYAGGTSIAAEGSYLFVAEGTKGIYVSSSNGSIWTQADSGLVNLGDKIVRCFAVDGSAVYAGTDNGVFLSTNNGTSWEQGTGLTISSGGYVSSLALSGANIFAGTFPNGVYLSSDSGATWSPANAGLPSTNILSLLAVPNGASGVILLAATDVGLSVSTDNGATWSHSGKGFPITSAQAMLSVPGGSGGVEIYGGTQNMGVFTSTDNGETWQDYSKGLGLTDISAIEPIPNGTGGTQLICGTSGQGAFTSSDQGATWIPVGGLPNSYVTSIATATSPSGSPTIYAGTLTQGVYASTDYGSTWTIDTSGFGTSFPLNYNLSVHSLMTVRYGTGKSIILVGTGQGIYRSLDGETWTIDTSGTGYGPYTTSFTETSTGSGDTDIFVGTNRGVFVSNDSGSTWTPIDTGLVAPGNSRLVFSLESLNDGTGGVHLFAGTVDTGLYESSSLGSAWSKVGYSPLADSEILSMAVSGTNIFVGTTSHLYLSTDAGATWSPADSGLPSVPIWSIHIGKSNLYVGTSGYGIWRRPISEMITSVEPSLAGETPRNFSLEQNYPNPFNPTTNIEYRIANFGFVSLKVYDILGREVATLVNAKQGPGNYSVTFDGSRLASGVYFYRLSAGRYAKVKKLLLLK